MGNADACQNLGILVFPTPNSSLHSLPALTHNKTYFSLNPISLSPHYPYPISKRRRFLYKTRGRHVGSSGGLLQRFDLVSKQQRRLINPLTTQKVNIPEPDFALEKGERIRKHGFGYDACNDDYKNVTLSYYDPNGPMFKYTDTFVDVYSVKTRAWKRFGLFPYNRFVPEVATGVFVNGALHWQASGVEVHYPCIITAFDLANEVFYEIKAPFIPNSVFKNLVARDGRLCVVPSYHAPRIDVWTMEDYGVVESWKKLAIGLNGVWKEIQPLCFVEEEQVVLTTEEERLVVYDVKEGTMKGVLVDGVPALCKDAGIFVESLVSVG